jgi:hypothetical protein
MATLNRKQAQRTVKVVINGVSRSYKTIHGVRRETYKRIATAQRATGKQPWVDFILA